jgi:hypothetical protein
VTGEPPLFAGAVKEIVASVLPTATVNDVGGLGTVDGVAGADATDSADVPMPFVATALKMYSTPLVKPLMEHVVVTELVVHVPDATLPNVYAVTVYPLMAEPFMLTGASQDTVAEVLDATAVTLIGGEGAAFTAMPAEASEAIEVPAVLVAVTLNVY